MQSIFSQFVPGAGTFKQGRLEREMGFSPSLMDTLRANTGGFVPEAVPPYVQGGSGGTQVMTPSRSDDPSIKRLYAPTMRNASSIPSIFSQPMVGDAVTVANNIDEVIPTRDRTGTFADGLDFVYKPRFPFDIPFTYARENPRFITDASGMKVRNPLIGRGSNRFTQENINLYSPFVTERPMGFSTGLMDSLSLNTGGFPTMGGVPSADPTIANPIRVGGGTVGDFRNQLFSNQALNTGLFTAPIFDRTQFNVPVGAFEAGSSPPINFEGKTYNERLQEGLDAAKAEFPNINAFIDTTLPLSTFNFGTNLTSSPTATEFDIFGNPTRNLGADEIISRYGDTINRALDGKSYTII